MSRRRGPRARLREVAARTTLRVKLVAGVLVLVVTALVSLAAASTTLLEDYLVDRIDRELMATADGPQNVVCQNAGPLATQFRDEAIAPSQGLLLACVNTSGDIFYPIPSMAPETDGSAPRLPDLDLQKVLDLAGRPFTVEAAGGLGEWRVLAVPLSDGSGALVSAQDLEAEQSAVGRLVVLQLVVGALVVGLIGVLGSLLVRRSLRPLLDVERTAAAIAAGDLSRRVPDLDPRTEVGRLSAAMNGMLAQIERAFRQRQQSEAAARTSEASALWSAEAARRSEGAARASEDRMRRFVADASHELRTPLTSIRGFAELSRQRGTAQDAEDARTMRRIESEAMRMGVLVEDLLLLARLDQQRPLALAPVDLISLAADAVHDARAVAPDRAISLDIAGGAAPVVQGDEARLRQVFANLVGNAVTHTPPGTPVEVRVGLRESRDSARPLAMVEVVDHGEGLTPDDAARVFERFYRTDASRTRASGGSGLGLSIVSALADAHGGRVELSTDVGVGSTFRVLLPLVVG